MSVVIADFLVNGLNPSTVGGTGTAIKYFPRLLGPSIGVAPLTPSTTSAVGALAVPGDNKLNAQLFSVNATGTFGADSGDPSGTVNVVLYAVTGTLTVPVYTALASIGAFTPVGASGQVNSWAIEAKLYGDSASGIVGGIYWASVNGAYTVAQAVVQNKLSGINFGAGDADFGFGFPFGLVVGVTFGTSDATNSAKLYQLQIGQ